MKRYASCFFGTDLLARLDAARVDTIVICGLATSGCIRPPAVDALQYGFRPIVVREAVGDRWQTAHDQELVHLDAKYAGVVSVDDAIQGIGQART